MHSTLERYLNDHLSGSAGAVDLIETLADNSADPVDEAFFRNLNAAVAEDRELLQGLLHALGKSQSKILEVVGNLTAKGGRLKLLWEGMDRGELGLFEALEMLSLGIEGKRSLWVMLERIAPGIPEWTNTDFAALAARARDQRDAVESRRLAAGERALVSRDPESR